MKYTKNVQLDNFCQTPKLYARGVKDNISVAMACLVVIITADSCGWTYTEVIQKMKTKI